jgi:uncharacterized protein involved in exopolysaccharide biosynthesis
LLRLSAVYYGIGHMNETGKSGAEQGSQVVFVVQQGPALVNDDLNLAILLRAIRCHRWWVIGLTILGTLVSTAYALYAQPVYRAESVLYARESRSAGGLSQQLSQLGGFADMAGISVGGGTKQEPLGVLRSKSFASRFITQHKLAPVIAPEWPTDDVRRATEIFSRTVLSVFEDRRTGLVTVGVKWHDAKVAADWANAIVRQLNDEMRARALMESESNIHYLRDQLRDTTTVSLQESISRLLETEMQKNMLARGTTEYSFRVIDAAEPPVRRVWPKRALIVVMAFSFSLLTSILVVALAGPLRRLWAGARAV